MGLTRRMLVLLLGLGAAACQGPNDMVLLPDTAAGSGGGAGASGRDAPAAGGGGSQNGTAAGSSGSAAAPSGGRASAAGSGGAGTSSGGATAGNAGTPAAGSAGALEAGRGGGAAGEVAAGSGGVEGDAGAGGDGGGGAGGDGGGGAGGEPAPIGAADPECDLTGIWAAKQVTVSEALGLPQSSNNWYYLEFKQSGTNVEVSKHFDCGIEVNGSATVILSRATVEALTTKNIQTGRKGTLTKEGNSCKFVGTRFWSIRGGDETRFLPDGKRDATESIDAVARALPLPTPSNPDGAIDTENDGKLGVAFQVTGIIAGTRNAVQRDWTLWFTEPGYEIPASTNWTEDLRIRADFDNEESIIDPTMGLLVSGSTPRAGAKHVLELRFLGRDMSDPRAAQIVKGTNVETCFAIQDALPAEQL